MCDETKKAIENLRRLLMESEPPNSESNDKSTDRTTQKNKQSDNDSGFRWEPLAGLIASPEERSPSCSQKNDDICEERINRIVFTDDVETNDMTPTGKAIAELRRQLEEGGPSEHDELFLAGYIVPRK